MHEELNIALIQSNIIWENPIQNRLNFASKIDAISDPVNLIVLPELFTTGFTMNVVENAETMSGDTLKWMCGIAAKNQAAIVGSIIISEQNKYHNRLVFVRPDGSFETYDKRHSFTLAGEHKVFEAGNEKKVIEYLGWSLCPQICYDLRFPVWARNTVDYDILIYVANWPAQRIDAWDSLLKARAIENMSYCIAVNRVGLDAKNLQYPGHSAVYNVLGKRLTEIRPNKECVKIVSLNKAELEKNRKHLGFLNDKDRFNLIV